MLLIFFNSRKFIIMETNVKKLKEQSAKDVKNLRKEHEKNVIAENKKSVSDDELMKDLSDLNVENLIKKSAKGRSIWKNEFKKKFADGNEKKARRLIRGTQINLCKGLLHNIITKQSKDICVASAKELRKFYNEGLNDFAIYSNVSQTESPEKYKVIHMAYTKMILLTK